MCYLEAEKNGSAVKLYEKAGYEVIDECNIELWPCEMEGSFTLVGMARQPEPAVAEETEGTGQGQVQGKVEKKEEEL